MAIRMISRDDIENTAVNILLKLYIMKLINQKPMLGIEKNN